MANEFDPNTGRSTDFESLPMRVGVGQFMVPTDEKLRYARQLGVNDILLNFYQYDFDYPQLPAEEFSPLKRKHEWEYEQLIELRNQVEKHDLRLNAIENLPISFYEDIILGNEGREEQIEHVKTTVRNMGNAGIPVLGYHWMPAGVWRTGTVTVRGGAEATSFDLDAVDDELTHDRPYTKSEMWENYEYFLEQVLPVAEDAGIKLCLHPNDPPVTNLGGIPQLFHNFESFKRAMEIVPSDNHGLELCLGCWSQMGENLEEVIRYFGKQDEIFYVHFRDVEGTVPRFHETFVDEGNYDELHIIRLLDEVGFSGLMISDHVPKMEDDTDWGHRGRALTTGYLRGMLRALTADG